MKFDANGWLDEAIEIDYTNKSMSREGHKITHIVNHGTAGGNSAEGIANYFAASDVQASAHFVIDQQGEIAQGIPLSLAAWGNGIITPGHASYIREDINPNLYTASIEHCKAHDDNSDALTAIQEQKSLELIKCICDTYGVPKKPGDAGGGIISHADIDPVNRSRCPGQYNWDKLWAYLKGQTTMTIDLSTPGVDTYFKATNDPAVWQCLKTGFLIGHGILGFYKKFGGDAMCGLTYLGLPTSNERAVAGHPGVVEQDFERATARYDTGHSLDNPPQSKDVYLIHVEQNPLVTKALAQVADLQKQIAALQHPQPANLVQINTLSKQIADDVQLILNLSSAQ
jgi:N-acetyl-anhydromuramyl-L-alanine amidase AmpD